MKMPIDRLGFHHGSIPAKKNGSTAEKMEGQALRVADVVARSLQRHGVSHAFGMPGGEVVVLVHALEEAGIGFHLARHETAAAIMAAGASVMTDTPQVLVTTVGPGLANAVNGIADAAQERVPLIVLSGIVDRQTRARYTHQVIDHAKLLGPLVKGSFEIEPESAAATVARAVALATTEPMGPVHLDISPAVAASMPEVASAISPPRILRPATLAVDPVVANLSSRIGRSVRPLIIAGFEAARRDAGANVAALAEAIGAPVITTYKAKGVIPEDHRLSLGAAGLSPLADNALLPLINRSDLVLAIGYDPIEMRLGWLDFVKDPDKLVEISGAMPDHGMHHAGLRAIADVRSLTGGLAQMVERRLTWVDGEPAKLRNLLHQTFTRPDAWGPHAIIEILNEETDDDLGRDRRQRGPSHPVVAEMDRAPASQASAIRRLLHHGRSPSLAIGAKVADPGLHVTAVMGDGGLEMGIGELATLRDLGLPITIVVFQDQSLALIALKQSAGRLPPAGVKLGLTDFATIAGGFGGYGVNVETTDDLRHELAAARDRPGFSLICCRFDARAYEGAF
ncbi:thiamine pyrophosphate-binding protein (plasmid) [Aliirhizobium terrae]|uniref:thiamine pyrophosphate-binding protein n=1 Tax=Terrirhizobium terrae TaxID=2926709 RepID=UPI002574A60B|nr:thiamine pyrophosphate-binding protein [Rhizobium sp. CC-CFT758]WJH38810.1 thiamine pyrophosphate-binding protein [Rhizobium sp. CC-CFT758]